MKLIAVAVVLVAIGIVLGLGLQGTVFEAEAKPPPPEPPTPQPVLEQNLDADGFIAVHEQGTADVNVRNLPVVQDVNVVSLPSEEGRLIELGTQTIPGGGKYQSPVADVSDCGRATLMAKGTSGFPISMSDIGMSPDGTAVIRANLQNGEVGGGGSTYSVHNLKIAMPFMRFVVSNGNHEVATDITAWIWCAP